MKSGAARSPDRRKREPSRAGRPVNSQIRLVFTGNIGRFQGLDTVIAALGKLRRASVQLTLMGDGSAVDALRTQTDATEGADVIFLPHGDVAAARCSGEVD